MVEESERVFSKLIRSIEKQSSEVKEKLRVQEKVVVSQAEEVLEVIQKEIDELRRTEAELERLSHTEDIYFLQVRGKFNWYQLSNLASILSESTTFSTV